MSIMNRHRRGRLRRALRSGVSLFAAGTLLASTAEPVLALPQGGQVAAGDAQIASNAAEMAIHQTSQNAVINWQSFNIAAGERVSVLQPNAQAALLNRVSAATRPRSSDSCRRTGASSSSTRRVSTSPRAHRLMRARSSPPP